MARQCQRRAAGSSYGWELPGQLSVAAVEAKRRTPGNTVNTGNTVDSNFKRLVDAVTRAATPHRSAGFAAANPAAYCVLKMSSFVAAV